MDEIKVTESMATTKTSYSIRLNRKEKELTEKLKKIQDVKEALSKNPEMADLINKISELELDDRY